MMLKDDEESSLDVWLPRSFRVFDSRLKVKLKKVIT